VLVKGYTFTIPFIDYIFYPSNSYAQFRIGDFFDIKTKPIKDFKPIKKV